MKKILVTGANGFVGQFFCEYLKKENYPFVGTSRDGAHHTFKTADLNHFTDWENLFTDVGSVVHLAAKAHDISGLTTKETYFQSNHLATIKLAEQAKKHGVKKFVFVSTIKVNGESTQIGRPFQPHDIPCPVDDYSQSKLQAELDLLKLNEKGIFEVIIIRPCLIYGPHVKANFKLLIQLIKTRLPLPFGLIQNKRSFISVENLSEIILKSINSTLHGEVLLASDDQDLSTKELCLKIGKNLNLTVILLPVPVFILKFLLFLMGKSKLSSRLFGNLQLDVTKTKQLLQWTPKDCSF